MQKRRATAHEESSSPYAAFGWRSALPLVFESLAPSLVDGTERETLRRFASELPADWYWGMFETRLTPGASQVDLLAALVQRERVREQIQEIFRSGGHPALDTARQTLVSWTNGGQSPFARTPNLWFEWDNASLEAPALHWLCIAPDFFDASQKPLSPEGVTGLADEFLRSSPQLAIPGATSTLLRIARALPSGGKLMGFASLKPRGKEACRVFARLPSGSTKAWLSAIGWSGDHKLLDELLPEFRVAGEDEWCQVEFGEDVGPYLALELAQTERGFPRREAREVWLEGAVARGWACPEKARAVLDWHGSTACSLPDSPPVKLLRSFHVKYALRPEREPEAKAYLGFYFRKKKSALAA